MDLPEAGVIAAVLTGIAGLIGAVFAGILQFRKLMNAHELAKTKVRADQYLVDFDELEDLRWWRRLAIGAVNKFLDDYATRQIDPPIDVHKALEYPPLTRPKSKSPRRRHLDE
jgi:hypothetical protein